MLGHKQCTTIKYKQPALMNSIHMLLADSNRAKYTEGLQLVEGEQDHPVSPLHQPQTQHCPPRW